jgi:hypothetical protein
MKSLDSIVPKNKEDTEQVADELEAWIVGKNKGGMVTELRTDKETLRVLRVDDKGVVVYSTNTRIWEGNEIGTVSIYYQGLTRYREKRIIQGINELREKYDDQIINYKEG